MNFLLCIHVDLFLKILSGINEMPLDFIPHMASHLSLFFFSNRRKIWSNCMRSSCWTWLSFLTRARYKCSFVLLAIQWLHSECQGLIVMLKGTHRIPPPPPNVQLEEVAVHHPQTCVFKPFRNSKQLCLNCFVRHVPAAQLDTPLSRQIFRERIQLQNHLGLLPGNISARSALWVFSQPLWWFVLCCLCTLVWKKWKEGGGGRWNGMGAVVQTQTQLLCSACNRPQNNTDTLWL